MSEYEFTEEERKLMYLYSHKRSTRLETISYYGIYVLPSLLFACYAVWKSDLIAAVTAYIALFIVVVIYLSRSGEYDATLASVCNKAEAMSKILKERPSNEI